MHAEVRRLFSRSRLPRVAAAAWLALAWVACGSTTTPGTPAAPRSRAAASSAPGLSHPHPQTSASSLATSAATAAPLPSAPRPKPQIWEPPSSVPVSAEGNPLPSLPRLYGGLASLRSGARTSHARVMWLGDSHTQPDIWPSAVRGPLQERFGNGGPGFLHVGFDKWGYRHQGVKIAAQGPWLLEPKRMLSEKPWGDGVLGLCGIRLSPQPDSTAQLRVDASALPGPATWDLAYRPLDATAWLSVQADSGAPRTIVAQGGAQGIAHEVWTTPGPGGSMTLMPGSRQVELMGVVVESSGPPGVVFDVLGLNGARAVHALAWDESAWVAEVARRKPDLLILAYGTNESGIKGLGMNRFAQQLGTLIDRARKAAPTLECLIVGAMDRGGDGMSARIERMNAAQEQAARDKGCAFWSAQRAMGGRGGMQRWAKETPPLGAGDHVHLTSKGYRQLGAMLARDLLTMLDAGTLHDGE